MKVITLGGREVESAVCFTCCARVVTATGSECQTENFTTTHGPVNKVRPFLCPIRGSQPASKQTVDVYMYLRQQPRK